MRYCLRVLDSASNVALPYVSVANEKTQEGWLANADGFVNLPCDSIAEFTFTYIGYTTVKISCQALIGNNTVKMIPYINELNEVVVIADDGYLYDAIDKARKKLKSAKKENAKSYLQIETERNGKPTELIQAFYNASIINGSIKELSFKNGRIGSADSVGKFFVTLGTSHVMCNLDLLEDKFDLPILPFAKSKSYNRKNFVLEKIQEDDDGNAILIGFKPRLDDGKKWSGKLWIDTKSFNTTLIDVKNILKNIVVKSNMEIIYLNFRNGTTMLNKI
jgi:hypothetical protein